MLRRFTNGTAPAGAPASATSAPQYKPDADPTPAQYKPDADPPPVRYGPDADPPQPRGGGARCGRGMRRGKGKGGVLACVRFVLGGGCWSASGLYWGAAATASGLY